MTARRTSLEFTPLSDELVLEVLLAHTGHVRLGADVERVERGRKRLEKVALGPELLKACHARERLVLLTAIDDRG